MKKWIRNGNIYIVIAFVIMGVLFYSSSQTYAQQSQIGLLHKLLASEPFKKNMMDISFVYNKETISIHNLGYFKFVEFFIRKAAHFTTYFILGGSWFLGLRGRVKAYFLTAFVSWQAATGYAGMDEFHQMVTGGRSPLFQDVMLDSSGALTAIVIALLFAGIGRLRGKR
jgi:VanZ family protein